MGIPDAAAPSSVPSSVPWWPLGERDAADGVGAVGEGLAAAFRAAALPASTRAAYSGDWARFQGWCAPTGVTSLPARPGVVAEYVAQAAALVGESGRFCYAPATLSRWVASLNAVHRMAGSPAPGDDPGVKATLRGIRATRKRPPRRAKPAGLEQLRTALAAIETERWPAAVIGRRDVAMLLLGFAGALRRSELVALTLADVEFDDGALILRLRSSKTDQEAAGQAVGYPRGTHRSTCVACAVLDWAAVLYADTSGGRVGVLRSLNMTRGQRGHACTNPDYLSEWRQLLALDPQAPLLRPVTKAATIGARHLAGDAVHEVLRRRLKAAGVDPTGFSAHSLRAGFITDALTAGANHHEVMRQTRHRSPGTVEVYARHYTPLEANAVTRIGL
jgi:integrase